MFLMFAALLAGFGALASIDHSNSYSKIDNLKNQKKIISSIMTLPTADLELAVIQLNGKSTQLHLEIDKLRSQYTYSFSEKYILSNSKEYLADLDTLSSLTTNFNQKSAQYYKKYDQNNTLNLQEMKSSFDTLYGFINTIILKSVTYNQAMFNIHKNITYAVFVIVLFAAIWYRKRLSAIYSDIEFLYNVNHKKNYSVFSEEIDAISLRMKRKSTISENPTMIDPVTGINNLKGMMNSYAEKKGIKEGYFTSVTVLEIDNFSKSNKVYSQEFTQIILKKVAFTLSLHQQATDVIARTDYNQFTVILSRPKKEQSFAEIDTIRKSISELKLSTPELGIVEITVSGGYVIKPNNVNLEESIRQAKKVLLHAQNSGKNMISQIKDLASSEL